MYNTKIECVNLFSFGDKVKQSPTQYFLLWYSKNPADAPLLLILIFSPWRLKLSGRCLKIQNSILFSSVIN